MKTTTKSKEIVKDQYATIALQNKDINADSCCGIIGCCDFNNASANTPEKKDSCCKPGSGCC